MNRRKFFFRSIAASTIAGAGYAHWVEPRWPQLVRRDLVINHLPAELDGATAIHISDTHIGHRVSENYLRRQFEWIESLKGEFVLFTGDFLDNNSPEHLEIAKRLLPAFPRGQRGNAVVLGNHDYGNGYWKHNRITQSLVAMLDDQGLNPLINRYVDLDGFRVVGLPDLWHGSFRAPAVRELLAETKATPSITLSHNPDSVDRPVWDDYDSWVLCGHTHGGQCRFPLVGAPFLPVRNRRYVAGAYEIDGGHHLYINRGLGHTMQVRFASRPEVTMFQLRPALG
ncbi:MAG: metallophosphoesterase [Planctomycetota bacterium]